MATIRDWEFQPTEDEMNEIYRIGMAMGNKYLDSLSKETDDESI